MEASSGICAGGCIRELSVTHSDINDLLYYYRFLENLRHLVEKQFTYDWRLVLLAILHILRLMSVERKNPLKRDQALNDATSGQIGEEPRPEPSSSKPSDINEQRMKVRPQNVKRPLTIPKIFWMADTRFEQFTNSR